MNLPSSTPPSNIRALPVQLDLTGTSELYGTMNMQGAINSTNAWTDSSGNFFKGTATESIQPQVLNGVNCYLITVTISYQSANHATKDLIRTTYVFQNGAPLQ